MLILKDAVFKQHNKADIHLLIEPPKGDYLTIFIAHGLVEYPRLGIDDAFAAEIRKGVPTKLSNVEPGHASLDNLWAWTYRNDVRIQCLDDIAYADALFDFYQKHVDLCNAEPKGAVIRSMAESHYEKKGRFWQKDKHVVKVTLLGDVYLMDPITPQNQQVAETR